MAFAHAICPLNGPTMANAMYDMHRTVRPNLASPVHQLRVVAMRQVQAAVATAAEAAAAAATADPQPAEDARSTYQTFVTSFPFCPLVEAL